MASKVSKVLPRVWKVAMPCVGARQRYQTEWRPGCPACYGSAGSRMEAVFVPRSVPLAPGSKDALNENASLPGGRC